MSYLVSPHGFGIAPQPGKRVAVVNFLEPAATGLQTVLDTTGELGGYTPKAAILIFGGIFADQGDQILGSWWSFGVTDGIRQWGTCAVDRDADPVETTHRAANTTWIAQRLTSTGALESRAAFDSFVPDGIVLNWTAVSEAEMLSTVILLAGDDVETYADVLLGTLVDEGLSVTAPGFQPNAVLFSHISASAHTNADAGRFLASLGWAVDGSPILQQSVVTNRLTASNSEAASWRNSDAMHYVSEANVVSVNIDVTDFTATGFDIDCSIDTTIYLYYFAIKIDGATFFAGADFARTTVGTQAFTGAGFSPDFGLFMTTRTQSGAPTTGTEMAMGAHAVGPNLEHGGASFYSTSTGTSQCNSTASNTAIHQQTVNGAAYLTCTVQSWDADGYTMDYTVAPAAAVTIPVLLIGGLD